MAVTDAEITKIVKAMRPVIREEIKEELKTVRAEIKKNNAETKAEFKTVRAEIKNNADETKAEFKAVRDELKRTKEELTTVVTDVVGTLADSLDNVYAKKKTEEEVENIREHLHATP